MGDKITKNGDKKYLTVKIEYDSNVTSQPALDDNDITLQMDYQQDLGQVPAYEAYSIGDKITFAGSDWYVIQDSTSEEDYVILLKETVLTNAELGNYAYDTGYDTMSYYWDDNCHPAAYGYTNESYSCDNTNSYATSKVKEFLEGTYINTLGTNNLKEVDGYKIRLITVDELVSNLGCTSSRCSESSYASFVYQNFGDQNKNVYSYWTMTSYSNNSSRVRYVNNTGRLGHGGVSHRSGVRPVINLLKANIS